MVVIGASDPGAMLAQAAECRANGYPFAADPSQQLPRMNGEQVLELITGADYLLTNEYEKSLLQSKAGLTDEQLLELVRVRVTTLGKDGVEIAERDVPPFTLRCRPLSRPRIRPVAATHSARASSPHSPGICRWSGPASWARWSPAFAWP